MITFVKNNFFPESSKEVLCSWRIKDQRGSRRYFKNSSEFCLLVKCIYITTCHNLQSILLYSQPIAWSRQRLQSLSLKVITVQIEVEWKCYFKTHSENAVFSLEMMREYRRSAYLSPPMPDEIWYNQEAVHAIRQEDFNKELR